MKIREITDKLMEKYGLYVSREQVRRLERRGLFSIDRDINEYREYSLEDYRIIERIVLLLEIGVKLEDIEDRDFYKIKDRIKLVYDILKQI